MFGGKLPVIKKTFLVWSLMFLWAADWSNGVGKVLCKSLI